METTNGIYNKTLYDMIHAKAVLMWQRVQVGNGGGGGSPHGQRPLLRTRGIQREQPGGASSRLLSTIASASLLLPGDGSE